MEGQNAFGKRKVKGKGNQPLAKEGKAEKGSFTKPITGQSSKMK